MKALCVGDLHIEQGANLDAPGVRVAEQEAAWNRALELSRETSCDAVLFVGDAWERRAPSPDGYLAFERPLVRHRNEGGPPVIAIPGNHDLQTLGAGAALDVIAEAGLLQLNRQPTSVELYGCDVTISCLPWAPVHSLVAKADRGISRDEINQQAARMLEDVAAQLGASAHTAGRQSVLLTHFSISGAVTATGADVGVFREPVLDRNVIGAGHAAVVAGHIHKRQRFSERSGFYVGSLAPLNFGETGEHGVTILRVDDVITGTSSIEFIDVESREFVTWDFTADDVDQMIETGAAMVELDGAYLRIRYDCTAEQAALIDKRTLRDQALAYGAHRVWIHEHVTRPVRDRTVELAGDMSDVDALALYLSAKDGLAINEVESLLERARPYLQAAR